MDQAPAGEPMVYDWQPLHHGAIQQIIPPMVAQLLPPQPHILLPQPGNRKLLRERSPLETELGTWLQEDNTLASPQKVLIKSLQSTEQCYINFTNNSPRCVQAVWLDFHGNEVAYSEIAPKESKKYRTYITHPWIMRDVESGERMLLGNATAVYGSKDNQDVKITMPPQLLWSTTTHTHFPAEFKAAARTLLLCHKRLSYQGSMPSSMKPVEVHSSSEFSLVTVTSPRQPPVLNALSRLAGWCRKPIHGADFPASPKSPRPSNQLVISISASCATTTAVFTPASVQPCCSSHLGNLPCDLAVEVIRQLAPYVGQCITMTPHGHPDIMPALLPSNPFLVAETAPAPAGPAGQ